MSYELKIDPKDRAAGRFIGTVRKQLITAALDEKRETGITQSAVAAKLGVARSVISRLLRGEANLTLRTVAEIAWALGWEPVFTMRRRSRRADLANAFSATEIRPVLKSGSETFTVTSTSTVVPTAARSSSVATVRISSPAADPVT